MKYITSSTLILLLLSGCDNGGGSSSNESTSQSTGQSSSQSSLNTLTLSGSDAQSLGSAIEFSEHVYYAHPTHGSIALIATVESDLALQEMNSVLKYYGDGKYKISPLANGEFGRRPDELATAENSVLLDIFPFGLVLSILQDEQVYRYFEMCFGGDELIAITCPNIFFDDPQNLVQFDDVELRPLPGDDNSATESLFVSGRFSWLQDNAVNIAYTGQELALEQGQPATAELLVGGLWDLSIENDQRLLQLGPYQYTWYDDQSDTAGSGDNCFDQSRGSIVALEEPGLFQLLDAELNATRVALSLDGETLLGFANPATLSEQSPGDLQPICSAP